MTSKQLMCGSSQHTKPMEAMRDAWPANTPQIQAVKEVGTP